MIIIEVTGGHFIRWCLGFKKWSRLLWSIILPTCLQGITTWCSQPGHRNRPIYCKKTWLPKEEWLCQQCGGIVVSEQCFLTQCPKFKPVQEQFFANIYEQAPTYFSFRQWKSKTLTGGNESKLHTRRTVCLKLPQQERVRMTCYIYTGFIYFSTFYPLFIYVLFTAPNLWHIK